MYGQYPKAVLDAISATKSNKQNITAALNYFYKIKDNLKIKSINFLVANMPIHKSYNYYWADSTGKRIPYDEMAYPSFKEAISAFENIKTANGKLHPVAYTYNDIDSIKSSMLIDNIELAVSQYRKANNPITENDFLEYVLPYRTSIEPLQNWRSNYTQRFANIINRQEIIDSQLVKLGTNIGTWFTNTYSIQDRKEPLPRLGGLQLLSRAKGPCEDIADLSAMILRSQGLPASCDMVTYWATSSGRHFCNGTFDANGTPIRFDASTAKVKLEKFDREPAKVLRTTFSNRPECLANIVPQDQIPEGFLTAKNYLDVTDLYWETDSFTLKINKGTKETDIIYACVFNYGEWRPTWWSTLKSKNALFTKMSKGVVYLPTIYTTNKKLIAAASPIVLDYNSKKVLNIDTVNTVSIHVPEKAQYLIYRPGKKYTLLYWNNKWVKHSEQIITDKKALDFNKVPSNTLYLLVPEYSQKKERPFIINDQLSLSYY